MSCTQVLSSTSVVTEPVDTSGIEMGNVALEHRAIPPSTTLSEEVSPSRYLYMFLCFSRRLFYTKIEIKNELIDDDPKVFKKRCDSYYKARGLLGRLSLIHSLTGIGHVKVLISAYLWY